MTTSTPVILFHLNIDLSSLNVTFQLLAGIASHAWISTNNKYKAWSTMKNAKFHIGLNTWYM